MFTQFIPIMGIGAVFFGLFLLLAAPLVYWRHSQAVITGLIVGGVVSEYTAGILGVANFIVGYRWLGLMILTMSGTVILWVVIAYFYYLGKNEAPPALFPTTNGNGSRLIIGKYTIYQPVVRTWRTSLRARFVCAPSDSQMKQNAWAFGKMYFGLWFEWATANANAHLEIRCRDGEADADDSGRQEGIHRFVRVAIKQVCEQEGEDASLVVSMGAALGDMEGPSVQIDSDPTEITLTYPNALLSETRSMGTYSWHCRESRGGDRDRFSVVKCCFWPVSTIC